MINLIKILHRRYLDLKIHTPHVVYFSKFFHRGCMDFKWSSPLLSHLDITCTPHGYHMHTSWVSHAHLMGITCTPHGYHMHTSWVSHAHLTGIRCTPIHLEITLRLWKTCNKSSTVGVGISNGVLHYLNIMGNHLKPRSSRKPSYYC